MPKQSFKLGLELRKAKKKLIPSGVDAPRMDADLMLSSVLKKDRVFVLTNPEYALTRKQSKKYRRLVRRRLGREPLAYILGHTEFFSLNFFVNKNVLIPRPETELLVEQALSHCTTHSSGKLSVLDIGTGSGNIIISIASNFPKAKFSAIDSSAGALSIARRNADFHGLTDKIRFLKGDLFAPLKKLRRSKFDLIVSNPPYVALSDARTLQPEVRRYEPRQALYAGRNGLLFIKRFLSEAHLHLNPGGMLIFEIGFGQANSVKEILESERRYDSIEFVNDFNNIPRIVKARCYG
ncbi:MAG: peptide chain release factor N(5)-glutamine methyltransferase [Planctomycetes bacterium]|nr:peptide chain release factor N(5)-glutamine methyltransferase [Planctomycetota bacterium]